MSALAKLLDRVKAATGPDELLDLDLAVKLAPDVMYLRYNPKTGVNGEFTHWKYTGKIDAAVALVERVLPGWWWKTGTCSVSDDACIAPDFNSPEHGERLKREFFPVEYGSGFDCGFEVDRRPPGNVPLAILESLLHALMAISDRRPANEPD